MCCKPLSSPTQMSTHKMKSTSNLFVFYMQGTVYRMECQLECFGNDFGNIGLLQSSCLMDSMDIHTRKSTKCKSVRTCWTTVKLMKTVSISNDNNGVTTVSQNQNDSSWNGSMEIPAERKSLRCSYHWAKWYVLSFLIKKVLSSWILLNLDNKQSTLMLSLWSEFLDSGQRRQLFFFSTWLCQVHISLKTVKHIEDFGWTILPQSLYFGVFWLWSIQARKQTVRTTFFLIILHSLLL